MPKATVGLNVDPQKAKHFALMCRTKKTTRLQNLKKTTHTSNQLATTVLPLKFSSDEET